MQREESKAIREFIQEKVDVYPSDISAAVASAFSISRQAASRHVQYLVKSGAIQASGRGRCVIYELKEIESRRYNFDFHTPLEEDMVWTASVKPIIAPFAGANAYNIFILRIY